MRPLSPAVALLEALLETVPCALGREDLSLVPLSLMPARFDRLLNHRGHMTAAVEALHGTPVAVRVLRSVHRAATYAREILLERPDGVVVQYAVVRLDLGCCPAAARAMILAERTPLGHVLQRLPGTLRIEPVAFVCATLPASLAACFGARAGQRAWGRLVRIDHDGDRLVEGLELLAPG